MFGERPMDDSTANDGHMVLNVSWSQWLPQAAGYLYSSPSPMLNVTTYSNSQDVASHPPKQYLKQPMSMIIILTVAYSVVFLLGVVNNVLVVTAIYRCPQLRTVTNFFIANLAVADILVCIVVLPITLLNNIFTEWWYGLFLCKATPYLQGVAVGASVNTLAAVAIERYLAIFFPRTTKLTPQGAVMLITVVWLIPAIIFIPWIVFYTITPYPTESHVYHICWEVWQSKDDQSMYFLGVVFLTCYLIPLIFIAIFYLLIGMRVWKRRVRGMRGTRAERNIHRSKIRIVRMLVVVFLVFVISWLPLYSIRLRVLFGPELGEIERQILVVYLMPLAQWLGSSNSCINPFIYCYFSSSFQRSIAVVIKTGLRNCCAKIASDCEGPMPSSTVGEQSVVRMPELPPPREVQSS